MKGFKELEISKVSNEEKENQLASNLLEDF